MLYDPKWQKPETKVDPLSLASLIAWLEQQPADKAYCFKDLGGCLLHQYFSAHGFKNVLVGGYDFDHRGPSGRVETIELGTFADVAAGQPHTYGAALQRAQQSAGRG